MTPGALIVEIDKHYGGRKGPPRVLGSLAALAVVAAVYFDPNKSLAFVPALGLISVAGTTGYGVGRIGDWIVSGGSAPLRGLSQII